MPPKLQDQHPPSDPHMSVSQQAPLRHIFTSLISYLAVGILTVVAITCMFSFFLFLSLVDDMIRKVVPGRVWSVLRRHIAKLDWGNALTRLTISLTRLAEWEKGRRASWYPYSQPFTNLDGERLQNFIKAVVVFCTRISPA